MTTRNLMAAVLGAIAMFIWSFIAHAVLPLGEIGVRQVPNEDALIDALKSNLGENHGLYIFPGLGVGPEATREEKHAAMQKAMEKGNNGPSGLLIYHPLRPF